VCHELHEFPKCHKVFTYTILYLRYKAALVKVSVSRTLWVCHEHYVCHELHELPKCHKVFTYTILYLRYKAALVKVSVSRTLWVCHEHYEWQNCHKFFMYTILYLKYKYAMVEVLIHEFKVQTLIHEFKVLIHELNLSRNVINSWIRRNLTKYYRLFTFMLLLFISKRQSSRGGRACVARTQRAIKMSPCQ